MELETKDPESTSFIVPPFDRYFDAGVQFFAWSVGLLLATLVLLQTFVLPNEKPPVRFVYAATVAVPIALVVAWVRYSRRYFMIVVRPNALELHRQDMVENISPAEVYGLLGLAGISLDGGEMIVWKRVVLIVKDGSYTVVFGAENNTACYHALRLVCRRAWGLPFRGDVEPPDGDLELARCELADTPVAKVERFYRRQIWTTFLAGLGLVIGSITASAAALLYTHFDQHIATAFVWVIVFFVVGLLLIAQGARQVAILMRFRRSRRKP